MNTAKNLDEVLSVVKEDDIGKWDRIRPMREFRIDERGSLYRIVDGSKSAKRIPTPYALSQLTNLVIPYKGGNFVAKSPSRLRTPTLNYYLSRTNRDKKCLVRGKDAIIRAVLSKNYAIYNNLHLIDAINELLGNTPHNVRDFYLDMDSMWLTITIPQIRTSDLGGLTGGIRVGNSEVGKRSIVCYSLVWRQICSNGLMGWGKERLFRQVHRGRINHREITAKLGEAVTIALDKADDLMDRLALSTQEPIPNISDVIKRIAKRRGLTNEFRRAMMAAIYREPQYANLSS